MSTPNVARALHDRRAQLDPGGVESRHARQPHETAVRRADLEQARGRAPIAQERSEPVRAALG
jgi:hypothetical protein